MSGPAADYCPFSKTVNLCVVIEPQEGLETHVYEKAGRMAGPEVPGIPRRYPEEM